MIFFSNIKNAYFHMNLCGVIFVCHSLSLLVSFSWSLFLSLLQCISILSDSVSVFMFLFSVCQSMCLFVYNSVFLFFILFLSVSNNLSHSIRHYSSFVLFICIYISFLPSPFLCLSFSLNLTLSHTHARTRSHDHTHTNVHLLLKHTNTDA